MNHPSPTTAEPRPGFDQLGVPRQIVDALTRQAIEQPFPIQTLTLPDSLAGRHVLAHGATGSGKTLAFAIPTVANVASMPGRPKPGHPRALILVPTRELAAQVATVVAPLAAAMSLRSTSIYGGVSQTRQVAALRSGIDILIACPGRLEDLIGQRHCSLAHVQITVLDEADHMADLGFLPAVKRLLDATPASGQRLLFSATLDKAIDSLVARYIVNPAVHTLSAPISPKRMEHHVLAVSAAEKFSVLREIASQTPRTLLFTRTKHGAKKLTRQLGASGIASHELHGNLSQSARARSLASFASGSTGVLVATDIAARGIHVDDIDVVVHVDPPADHKAYLHRSGRTARAGESGVVAILMTPDQRDDVRRLVRTAGITATTTTVTTGHPLLASMGARQSSPSEQPRRPRRDRKRPSRG